MRRGGARAVVAESLLVKHQLVILNRGRERAPNLRPLDRVFPGLCTAQNSARKTYFVTYVRSLLQLRDDGDIAAFERGVQRACESRRKSNCGWIGHVANRNYAGALSSTSDAASYEGDAGLEEEQRQQVFSYWLMGETNVTFGYGFFVDVEYLHPNVEQLTGPVRSGPSQFRGFAGPTGALSLSIPQICEIGGDSATMARVGDQDNDLISDAVDNCIERYNPNQRDSNGDGFGNACDPDLNDDGQINFVDLGLFRQAFFERGNLAADLDSNGIVNVLDLARFREFFFLSPGPSGLNPPE